MDEADDHDDDGSDTATGVARAVGWFAGKRGRIEAGGVPPSPPPSLGANSTISVPARDYPQERGLGVLLQ
jgi:hypothetical protein